jgi:hypothetical protein
MTSRLIPALPATSWARISARRVTVVPCSCQPEFLAQRDVRVGARDPGRLDWAARRPARIGPEKVIAGDRDGQPVHHGVGNPDGHLECGREGKGTAGGRRHVLGSGRAGASDLRRQHTGSQFIDVDLSHGAAGGLSSLMARSSGVSSLTGSPSPWRACGALDGAVSLAVRSRNRQSARPWRVRGHSPIARCPASSARTTRMCPIAVEPSAVVPRCGRAQAMRIAVVGVLRDKAG